jgi:hypothetical protein
MLDDTRRGRTLTFKFINLQQYFGLAASVRPTFSIVSVLNHRDGENYQT